MNGHLSEPLGARANQARNTRCLRGREPQKRDQIVTDKLGNHLQETFVSEVPFQL